ncbi:TPA: hypothetical protein PP865_002499 [Staphylococcus aureus]|nr:hypothetical protein [Staphylococcus aureus]HDJ3113213.1 hypothetical protein [Staphylococcus aureus]
MNQCALRKVLWNYLYSEFNIFEATENDMEYELSKFIDEYKKDEVYIANSDFGNHFCYTGCTIFLPSKLKLIKRIFNFNTMKSVTLYKQFNSISEVENYFLMTSFDAHLQPDFDEDILDSLTK